MIIPKHLQNISEIVKTSKNSETIKMQCTCGHMLFKVYENYNDICNNKMYISGEIRRENGHLYFIKRNWLGLITDRIDCGDSFIQKQRKVVKIICDNCEKEYVVFDNYKHGYDAVLNFECKTNPIVSNEMVFKTCYDQALRVFIEITQDVSFEEFQDEFNELSFEDYLTSFSNINIYAFNSRSRRIKIYSEETS